MMYGVSRVNDTSNSAYGGQVRTVNPVAMRRKIMAWKSVGLSLVVCLFVVTTGLGSRPALAQLYCQTHSAVDTVPYFVAQTYADLLDRAPDTGGQNYYIGNIENLNRTGCSSANTAQSVGACEWTNNAQTAMAVLQSSEFFQKNGDISDNTTFATKLYDLLLRRNPDQAGLNYYVSLLNGGTKRATVVQMFLQSPEYRERFACAYNGTDRPTCNGGEPIDSVSSFVSQLYLDIFNRPADGTGQGWWTNYTTANQLSKCRNSSGSAYSTCDRLVEGLTVLQLFNSSEYLASNPPVTDNGTFVSALYQHLLQRAPDTPGLDFYTHYLDQTNDRLGTLQSFLTSNEYRKRFACYSGVRDQINFGINGHPLDPALLTYSNITGIDYNTQISLIQNAGLTWYRVNVPVADTGTDFTNMDLLLTTAQASGVQLLPLIVPTVDLNSGVDQLYAYSYSAAYDIVNRYKSSIHVWELMNEEDLYSLYGPGDPYMGGKWPWGPPDGDKTSDYYPPRLASAEAILHGLADGARAADPSCLRIVNFAWLHTGFLQNLENDQIPYDIVGVHWYSNTDLKTYPAMGEITCPTQSLPCTTPLAHFNVIQRVQSITNGKPMWITETNYKPFVGNSIDTDLSMEASYLPMVLPVYQADPSTYPFQVVVLYELLDEPDVEPRGPDFGEMGLYQDTLSNGHVTLGNPKDVLFSIQQIVK